VHLIVIFILSSQFDNLLALAP